MMVSALLTGPFGDAIRTLQETPLAETTANMADQWSAEGEMQAILEIEVPIGVRGEEEVRSDVLVSIENAVLQIFAIAMSVGLALPGLRG